MDSFLTRYTTAAMAKHSVLCMGLDLEADHVPHPLRSPNGLILDLHDYLAHLLDIAAPRVPVVKPQAAYYEALGGAGLDLLHWLVTAAHDKDLLVILDAKKADIGATMAAYAAYLEWLGVDACTFVPYLGSTIFPGPGEKSPCWLEWMAGGRCAISMVRTSNPEADQLQDRTLEGGLRVYEDMAQQVRGWNDYVLALTNGTGCVGGVVGATWPEQAEICRKLLGDDVFILTPGYGAQGGGANDAVIAVTATDGRIIGVVNSSRGLTRNSWFDKTTSQPKPGDPLEHVVAAVNAANTELNAALTAKLGRDPYATAA